MQLRHPLFFKRPLYPSAFVVKCIIALGMVFENVETASESTFIECMLLFVVPQEGHG